MIVIRNKFYNKLHKTPVQKYVSTPESHKWYREATLNCKMVPNFMHPLLYRMWIPNLRWT